MRHRQLSRDYRVFTDLLAQATANIEGDYMQLPVAGREALEYRERVYCYELYHRLRSEMDGRSFRYSLGGEVDKAGHRYIRGNNLDRVKPDLLVHKPGEMTSNLVAMEVKPIVARKPGIRKDLLSLTAFRAAGGYHRAILLVYGGDERALARLKDKAAVLSEEHGAREIDLELVDLYWHPESTRPAEMRSW